MLKEGPCWNQLHYLFEDLSNLLAGDFLWGVGILEGLAVDGREPARGIGLCVWGTVSTSEHTDWISEMSKSDASLPRRLLALLPALLPARLPGRLGVFLGSKEKGQRWFTFVTGSICNRPLKPNAAFNLNDFPWHLVGVLTLRKYCGFMAFLHSTSVGTLTLSRYDIRKARLANRR